MSLDVAAVRAQFPALASGVAVTEIGRIVAGRTAPLFRDRVGQVLEFARPSFSHF